MKNLKKLFALALFLACAAVTSFAVPLSQLRIVAADGTFLGTFESEYSTNSVYNEYGSYGSPYSTNSIMNKYGSYGSDYSSCSPFNKYASEAPWIVDRYGNSYGRLSVNRYASGVTRISYEIALDLKALRDSY